jgi:HAD superfamily hydrolase (TIGR01509 family)
MQENREHNDAGAVVLFDVDGTLINTKRLYAECYRRVVRSHLGRELTVEEVLALRPRSELRFMLDVVGPDRLAACMEDFYRAYAELHDDHFRGIYDGVLGMLEALRARPLRLGIVTGKSRRSWELTSAREVLGAFDVLVFDDDVTEPKPDPQGLRIALERLGAPPDRAVYLGDSVTDMEAATAAGVRPCAALWAKKPADREAFITRVEPYGAALFETPESFARFALDGVMAG